MALWVKPVLAHMQYLEYLGSALAPFLTQLLADVDLRRHKVLGPLLDMWETLRGPFGSLFWPVPHPVVVGISGVKQWMQNSFSHSSVQISR